MISSEKFEVSIVGTHGLEIPEEVAKPFLEAGHSRVAFKAYFNGSEIFFTESCIPIPVKFL
jgi:hypothetical protein